jgi:hypothetical protein
MEPVLALASVEDLAGVAMRHLWRNLAVAGALALAGSCVTAYPAAALTGSGHGEPTLGLLTGTFVHGSGFGQVKPRKVYNGGDPTGLVTSITWHDWGEAQAVGTGLSDYVGPGQFVAQGKVEPVRIVAFDLGTCNGRYMYAAVEWYFPQHKQAFNASQFEDTCIGAYYPPQTGPYFDSGTGAAPYQLTLSGTPGSLGGSVSRINSAGKVTHTLFSFHGRAQVNGSLALVSKGPFETGHTFSGSWQTLGVILANCRSYLQSAATPKPSCTFYWG